MSNYKDFFSGGSSINWLSSAAAVTATASDGIMADTTVGVFTVTLPASPAPGDSVNIRDAAGTFATNNLTVNGNGNNVDGAATLVLNTNNDSKVISWTGVEWKSNASVGGGAGGGLRVISTPLDPATQVSVTKDFPNTIIGEPAITQFASLIQGRTVVATVVHNNNLYVYGGYPYWGTATQSLKIFDKIDLSTGVRTALTAGPNERGYNYNVLEGVGAIYLVAGENVYTPYQNAGLDRYYSDMWKYDIALGSWTQIHTNILSFLGITPANNSTDYILGYGISCIIGNLVYFTVRHLTNNYLLRMDLTSNVITQVTVPAGNTMNAGGLFQYGATSFIMLESSTLWTYDTATTTWTSIPTTGIVPANPGLSRVVSVVGDVAYIVERPGATSDTYSLNLITGELVAGNPFATTYTKVPAFSTRSYFNWAGYESSAADSSGNVYFSAGYYGGSTITTDVIKYNPTLDIPYRIILPK